MTTANRPTFNPVKGGSSQFLQGAYNTGGQVSRQFSARDLPGHLTLKTRQFGQGTTTELSKRDLKAELLAKEQAHFENVRKEKGKLTGRLQDAPMLALGDQLAVKPVAPVKVETTEKSAGVVRKGKAASGEEEEEVDVLAQFDDADDDADESSSSSSSSEDEEDEDEDDEDETEELMRELEKIKKERADEAARIEAQKKFLEERESRDAVLGANPLLKSGGAGGAGAGALDATVKRRWDDDVVFKNQARDEPQAKKRFINDTIRNDFHRKFLTKFIQ